MNWPLMRRSNAVPRARYEQVIDQRDEARTEAARHVCQIVELCGEVDELREQLAAAREQLASMERTTDTTAADRRLDVARKATSRVLAAYHAEQRRADTEKRRADQLQRRLDDACGLNTSKVTDGRRWQQTRSDKKGAVS